MYNMQQKKGAALWDTRTVLSVRVLLSLFFCDLALQILLFMPKGNLLVAPYDKQGGSGDYFIPEFQLPQRQHTDNTKKVESTKIQCLKQ